MDTYTLPILLEGEHWTLTSVRLNAFIIFGEARQSGADPAGYVGEALLPGLDRVGYTGINTR